MEKGIFESIITLPLSKILNDSLSDNYRIANYFLKMIMEFIIKSNHAMEVKTNKNKIYRGFKNILYSVFPDNEFYGILREDKFYKVFATRQYEYDYDYKKYYLSKAKDLFGQRIR